MFDFISLKNRLRLYVNVWFTLLEKKKISKTMSSSTEVHGTQVMPIWIIIYHIFSIYFYWCFFFQIYTVRSERLFFFLKWIEGVICFTKRGALIRFDQLLQLSKYKFTNWYWLIQSERIIKVFSNDLCYYEPSCVFKLIHLENMVFMIKKKCSIWKGFKIE